MSGDFGFPRVLHVQLNLRLITMEYFQKYFCFLMIIGRSIQLFSKNAKLMALVITISLLTSSIFFLLFDFSSLSLTRDMLAKESLIPITSASSSEFNNRVLTKIRNFPLLLSVYIAFVFSYSFIAVLSMIATVIVTSESCNSKTLSLKALSSRILKYLRRPIATGFYTTIFIIGYVFLVIYLAGPLLSNSSSNPFAVLGFGLLFSMFAYIIYLYMSSVWILGLVVSVLDEESCGLVALGKSSAMIKHYRFNGFFLNIFLNLMTLALFIGLKIVKGNNNWLSDDPSILSGLYLVNCSCLVKIFSFVAYTVLYFKCKENPDEEIELGGYGKISTATPLFSGVP